MKINMLYFVHTHTLQCTRTLARGVSLSELVCSCIFQPPLLTPSTTCRHLRCVLSKCSIYAQHGVCVLYCRIIWHAIKTDFNALQPTSLPSAIIVYSYMSSMCVCVCAHIARTDCTAQINARRSH